MIGILKWYLLPSSIATKGKTNLKQLPANLLGQELMRFPNVWSTDVSEAITFESKQPLWDVLLSCISWPLTRKGQTWGRFVCLVPWKINNKAWACSLISIHSVSFQCSSTRGSFGIWICYHQHFVTIINPARRVVKKAIATRKRGPGSIPGPTRIFFLSSGIRGDKWEPADKKNCSISAHSDGYKKMTLAELPGIIMNLNKHTLGQNN